MIKGKEVLFRDLTSEEISFLQNIKNDAIRAEFAGRISTKDINKEDIPWSSLMQIGQEALSASNIIFSDEIVLEMTVKDMREKVNNDFVLASIIRILKTIPSQSFTDLIKLTPVDLLELVCICEKLAGESLFEFDKKKKGISLVNPKDLPDEGKSLQKEIARLNSEMGIK